MSIYQSCDIRGNAVTELTPQLYRSWGRALGRQVEPMDKFVVGGDGRASTPGFLAALVEGLCRAGVDVVDLGVLPTPMIYYAKERLQAAACAIVTGSHHPAPINGLKWMVGQQPPTSDDVAALQRAAEAEREAQAKAKPGKGRKAGESTSPGDAAATTSRTVDVSFDYVACLQETFVAALGAQRRVVLDPLSGCWAGKVRRYLTAIFPQSLFSTIHNTPSADFEGRTPDCSWSNELHELGEAVYRDRAHFGIAFDGDGDRLALVDNEGVVLRSDETAWMLLQSFGSELSGQTFVHDVKLSGRIVEAARQLGGRPLVERSGPTRIRDRMHQTGALFGMECTGHYFFRAWHGCDDSLFAACRLLAWLADRGDQTLADLRLASPSMYISPELHVPMAVETQLRVLKEIRKAWAQYPQQTFDGVRIDTPSGWILASRSVTSPALTFRFEGIDWSALDRLVEQFCDSLPQWGDPLWQQYRIAMGMEES